jgi:hypothetical protein
MSTLNQRKQSCQDHQNPYLKFDFNNADNIIPDRGGRGSIPSTTELLSPITVHLMSQVGSPIKKNKLSFYTT